MEDLARFERDCEAFFRDFQVDDATKEKLLGVSQKLRRKLERERGGGSSSSAAGAKGRKGKAVGKEDKPRGGKRGPVAVKVLTPVRAPQLRWSGIPTNSETSEFAFLVGLRHVTSMLTDADKPTRRRPRRCQAPLEGEGGGGGGQTMLADKPTTAASKDPSSGDAQPPKQGESEIDSNGTGSHGQASMEEDGAGEEADAPRLCGNTRPLIWYRVGDKDMCDACYRRLVPLPDGAPESVWEQLLALALHSPHPSPTHPLPPSPLLHLSRLGPVVKRKKKPRGPNAATLLKRAAAAEAAAAAAAAAAASPSAAGSDSVAPPHPKAAVPRHSIAGMSTGSAGQGDSEDEED